VGGGVGLSVGGEGQGWPLRGNIARNEEDGNDEESARLILDRLKSALHNDAFTPETKSQGREWGSQIGTPEVERHNVFRPGKEGGGTEG